MFGEEFFLLKTQRRCKRRRGVGKRPKRGGTREAGELGRGRAVGAILMRMGVVAREWSGRFRRGWVFCVVADKEISSFPLLVLFFFFFFFFFFLLLVWTIRSHQHRRKTGAWDNSAPTISQFNFPAADALGLAKLYQLRRGARRGRSPTTGPDAYIPCPNRKKNLLDITRAKPRPAMEKSSANSEAGSHRRGSIWETSAAPAKPPRPPEARAHRNRRLRSLTCKRCSFFFFFLTGRRRQAQG